MADIPGWLRNFPLGRTPYFGGQDPSRSSYFGDINKFEQDASRIKPSSRSSSSYLDNGRAKTPSRSNTMDSIGHTREADRVVWHNPNPHQMAETLKVVMMMQGCFEPVPVQYNSCILHVLEAYHDMRLEIIAKEKKIQEEEQRLADAINIYEKQKAEWTEKEEDYKAELKKLEIMLAGGERGLDLVTLARSKSTLQQEKRQAAKFRDRKMDDQVNGACFVGMEYDDLWTVEFSAQKDARISALLMSPRNVYGDRLNTLIDAPAKRRAHQGGELRKTPNASSQRSFQKHIPPNVTASGEGRKDSNESSDSASESDAGPTPNLRGTVCLHFADEDLQRPYHPNKVIHKDNLLPEIPHGLRGMELEAIGKSQRNNKRYTASLGNHQQDCRIANIPSVDPSAFSFVPGDDCNDNLLFTTERMQRVQTAGDIHTTHAGREIEAFVEVARWKQLGNNNPPKPTHAMADQASPGVQNRDISRGPARYSVPQRNDSRSSVVTAVRNNSDRSETKITSGLVKTNRHNGNSEATIAAARAIAISDRKENGKLRQKSFKKDSEGLSPYPGEGGRALFD